jgi:hypothetical protein
MPDYWMRLSAVYVVMFKLTKKQLDSSCREAYRLSAGNGMPGDLHEFHISKDGTALLTQYLFEEAQFGGRKGYIWDSVIQEVEIETNKVVFEWHASDHFNIDGSEFPPGSTGRSKNSGYDFFHINSIDKNYLWKLPRLITLLPIHNLHQWLK